MALILEEIRVALITSLLRRQVSVLTSFIDSSASRVLHHTHGIGEIFSLAWHQIHRQTQMLNLTYRPRLFSSGAE